MNWVYAAGGEELDRVSDGPKHCAIKSDKPLQYQGQPEPGMNLYTIEATGLQKALFVDPRLHRFIGAGREYQNARTLTSSLKECFKRIRLFCGGTKR
jgi:hypothetical protein